MPPRLNHRNTKARTGRRASCSTAVYVRTKRKIRRISLFDHRRLMGDALAIIIKEAAALRRIPDAAYAEPTDFGGAKAIVYAEPSTKKLLEKWMRKCRIQTVCDAVDLACDVALIRRGMPITMPEPPEEDE